jgi:amphiphysin
MLLEKLTAFAEGKYDVSVPGSQIAAEYEEKRSDTGEQIENLSITKRILSTCERFG